GDRAEGGDAGVVAQDRHRPVLELGHQHAAGVAIGQVDPAHLDLDPVGGAQLGGEFLHHLGPAGDEDQRVAAGGELTGQAHADAGGSSGDHGAGLGGGGGQGHGGDLLRSAPARGGGGRSGSVREHRLDRLA